MLWNPGIRYTREALKSDTVRPSGDLTELLNFTEKVNPRCHAESSHPGSLFCDVVQPVFVQNHRQPRVDGLPLWGGQLRLGNSDRPLRLLLPIPDRQVNQAVPVLDIPGGDCA